MSYNTTENNKKISELDHRIENIEKTVDKIYGLLKGADINKLNK